jgi:CBS-domain-containing membrane protein
MFDAIIAKPKLASQTSDDMEYWIDIHENDCETFLKHMKKYSMRKNIRLDDISHVIKSFAI